MREQSINDELVMSSVMSFFERIWCVGKNLRQNLQRTLSHFLCGIIQSLQYFCKYSVTEQFKFLDENLPG
jgi:hypothetical protein